MKLNATDLRDSEPTIEEVSSIRRNPIVFVLDEILDTFNIGSMFRLADAVAAEKMYLCGNMATPPYHRIHKAAVGTENWVPWEKSDSTLETVKSLKGQGYWTVAIEQNERSVPYYDISTDKGPVALILGHETSGVRQQVLQEVDEIVEFPMYGVNMSFNVWGAAAVVAYRYLEKVQRQ